MRILLTNDNGIHAEGLACLKRIANQLSDDVWVVVSESNQFGFAHSLAISKPLRLRKIALNQAYIYENDERIVPYETAEALAPALLRKLIATELQIGVLLNLNFPNFQSEKVNGPVMSSQGKLAYGIWV